MTQTQSTEPQVQAKPAKTKAAPKGDGFFADFGAFPNAPVPEVWLNSSESLIKNSFEMARRCIDFGQARMHEDFKTLEKMMSCKDFTQIAECQKAFTEKASQQYFDQLNGMAQRLATMMGMRETDSKIDVTALPD